MIIAATTDYREAARRRLPRFLFDYIDGGAFSETTLRRNIADLADVALKQRVLRDMGDLSLETELFGERWAMPVGLAPIGLAGMTRRRGEVQAARAACAATVPYTLSTVSVCAMKEVTEGCGRAPWFQLYVLKDRGFMKDTLDRAWALGSRVLVFTVDMPLPGARYRDPHSGMSGPNAPARRMVQAMFKPECGSR